MIEIRNNKRVWGLLMASMTAFLWGILAIVLKFSLHFASVETIVWFRFTFAFFALSLILYWSHPQFFKILQKPPPLGILMSAFLVANYFFYFKGLEYTTASNAQVFIQTAPLGLAAIGIIYFGERVQRTQVFGFILAVVGLFFFFQDQMDQVTVDPRRYQKGVLIILIGSIVWALWGTLQKILLKRGYRPQELNLLIYLVGAISFLPFANFSELQSLSILGWIVMIFLGANTLLAYGALTEALNCIPANQVGVIITLNPLITLTLMKLFLLFEFRFIAPEYISVIGYLGAMLLILGVILAVSPPRRLRVLS